MIDEATAKALLIDIHREIRDVAIKTTNSIAESTCDLVYPPNEEFTPEEVAALRELRLPIASRTALEKIIADAASSVIFHFFALVDGVADPATGDFTNWLGVSFVPKIEENTPMLHDEFFDSYWDYKDHFE